MTVRRLFAVGFIFVATAIAWFTLGSSVVVRTGETGASLGTAIRQLWGDRHVQTAPQAVWHRARKTLETVKQTDEQGNEVVREIEKTVYDEIPIPIAASRIETDLQLEHRRKGLQWYDTYSVDFAARYRFEVPTGVTGPVTVRFRFPSAEAIYDGFSLAINGRETFQVGDLAHGITTSVPVEPGATTRVEVAYRSRGLDTWSYRFADRGVATVRDFQLAMTTDFHDIDFPPSALSPVSRARTPEGWLLGWSFDSLVSGKAIGMDLPNRLNPGPLTARITFFAPVSLLFFITILVVLDVLGHLKLHPAHYFFLSAAFFAFHLLLAYLVDHLDVHLAFGLAAATSVTLVVSYLRLVCGFERALRYAGSTQIVFLVLFSYAFFFEGYTGLTVTIGAVITLFVLMQLTGTVDWEKAFGPRSRRDATPSEAPAA